MKRQQRLEMLQDLHKAWRRCIGDPELFGLAGQIRTAVDFLAILVAGERRCGIGDLAKFEWPPRRGTAEELLREAEELVRGVYVQFEEAVSKEKCEDAKLLTLGDNMVLGAVKDAVWMIGGIWDDIRSRREHEDCGGGDA